MITLENIPRSGVLIISVHFREYKGNYANDTRRKFEGWRREPSFVERLKAEGFTAELIPFDYWLGRTIVDKVTRATGGLYKFGFSSLTPEDFKILYKVLMDVKNELKWWEDVEILVATRVEGFE